MAIDLREHKLDRAFGHLDVGGGGEIDREDLLGLGARLLVGFGESPTSLTGRRLVDGLDGIWAALTRALDRDADARLTAADFRAGMTAAFVAGELFQPVFHPAAEAVADLCDHDRDGRVGPREFRVMLSAFGVAYDEVDEAFDRLDRDRDGTLTVSELVAAAREYYTGDDPHAAGNWLFGPLWETSCL
ncbi:EF-hand domain-containing protein [Thermoactinospora rubra]|uniref:EF-hand domain-containing protein n=1 Tax=Thermoactinospora rubra TaxID=1088767 RepID=UPI000A11E7CC|nr:EF-hand domain-containing protein [Thermoactinospora rubra]